MAGYKPLRLPAQPLLDRIERNGGLAQVMEMAGIATEVDSSVRASKTTQEYETTLLRLTRAREDGYFTFKMADEICCGLLKVHPIFVFGDEQYFNPIDPNVPALEVVPDSPEVATDYAPLLAANAA